VSHPGEVERWHILADWLEDQQDPRAELARLRFLLHAEPDHPERNGRASRQLELLDQGFAPVVPTWTNSIGMQFAVILPGSFWMGSPNTEEGHDSDEVRHFVTLAQPYFLGVYPVTVGEFRKFVETTGYRTEGERGEGSYGLVNGAWRQDTSVTWASPGFAQTERHPVVCVSGNDAQAMVAWLNEAEKDSGLIYSLPSEAQWEYAYRAGTTTAYFWGETPDRANEFAWYSQNAGRVTHPVGSRKPNPWGLYHMAGLVEEWCLDQGNVTDLSVESEGDEEVRILRGGSWYDSEYGSVTRCRAASRRGFSPETAMSGLGFRLAALGQPGGASLP
jgi:formylglycine-generating enzyme required for sulfatase activity